MVRNPNVAQYFDAVRKQCACMQDTPSPAVQLTLPGGVLNGLVYWGHEQLCLYLPVHYQIYRECVYPAQPRRIKRKRTMAQFIVNASDVNGDSLVHQPVYMFEATHGPVHGDGQPRLAIGDDIAHLYPAGPIVILHTGIVNPDPGEDYVDVHASLARLN